MQQITAPFSATDARSRRRPHLIVRRLIDPMLSSSAVTLPFRYGETRSVGGLVFRVWWAGD
jgi:hypothetical protein